VEQSKSNLQGFPNHNQAPRDILLSAVHWRREITSGSAGRHNSRHGEFKYPVVKIDSLAASRADRSIGRVKNVAPLFRRAGNFYEHGMNPRCGYRGVTSRHYIACECRSARTNGKTCAVLAAESRRNPPIETLLAERCNRSRVATLLN